MAHPTPPLLRVSPWVSQVSLAHRQTCGLLGELFKLLLNRDGLPSTWATRGCMGTHGTCGGAGDQENGWGRKYMRWILPLGWKFMVHGMAVALQFVCI